MYVFMLKNTYHIYKTESTEPLCLSGRPFAIELVNPHRVQFTEQEIKDLQQVIVQQPLCYFTYIHIFLLSHHRLLYICLIFLPTIEHWPCRDVAMEWMVGL